ncbi:uncharacterized protein [Centroberyx affinis]|uniref:uncharacterized protein isoform X1 n=1 Tax=Centroberyx affinis TaxID=166261 RepID=UPI003A5B93BC
MPRLCIVVGCQGVNSGYFFPRDENIRLRWMAQLEGRTRHPLSPTSFICCAHFRKQDFSNWYQKTLGFASKLVLKKGAVPSLFDGQEDTDSEVKTEFDSILPLSEDALPSSAEPVPPLQPETKDIASQYVNLHLQDNWTSMGKRLGHFRSKGIQVNLPRRDVSFNVNEMCPLNMERPTVQHIIDEKAILQLLEHCPKCNRKCRCTKHTRSPYFIVYQNCYFCEYRRKWANQPEARNIKILKQRGPKKKKLPALNTESVNAEPQPSHLEKICVSKSPDSESNHQLQS